MKPSERAPEPLESFMASAEAQGDLVQEVFGVFNASSHRAAELHAFLGSMSVPLCVEAITGNPGSIKVVVILAGSEDGYTILNKAGHVRVFMRSPKYD